MGNNMKREPNITPFRVQKFKRQLFHNPLFNLLSREFDNVFKEFHVSEEYILEKFYVDSRLDKTVTNHDLISRFSSRPK